MLDFYQSALLAIITEYEQEIAYKLLRRDEQTNMYFRFNVDALLRASNKERTDSLTNLVKNGVYTANEAREKLDMFEHPAGNDLTVNGSTIPLSQAGKQYNNKKNNKGGDD